ncbi:Serine/arginine repetitive matrix protein 1 [Chionoecetes opilio]|uniref:Serine/arginine repetitive matrix protein 1 n=1 Tax=Chionoecetes opilio TaxID=41210 RepID=A0A8J4XU85_CHIOP|nr:Serine/arginine repetitive matrix protein 1 [Chionoecetes opilio]
MWATKVHNPEQWSGSLTCRGRNCGIFPPISHNGRRRILSPSHLMCRSVLQGTSAEQDNRFSNKDKKLMKEMKFAESLAKKVDMTKVRLEVVKPWVTERITAILGMEDDVVIEYVFNQLEADKQVMPKGCWSLVVEASCQHPAPCQPYATAAPTLAGLLHGAGLLLLSGFFPPPRGVRHSCLATLQGRVPPGLRGSPRTQGVQRGGPSLTRPCTSPATLDCSSLQGTEQPGCLSRVL